MTLPAFSAAGVGSTGNPSWPTHAAGHLGLLFIEWDGTNSPSTPSGWNVIPGFPITQPSTKLAGFYRFATSSGESAPTITITAEDHHWAVIVTYTGVNSINPFHIVSTTSSASISLKTLPGFTTFLPDCLIVNVLGWGLDSAGPLFGTETNADLGSLAERYDAGTTTASGGGVYVNDGTKAVKGEFTYTQVTPSTNTISNGATIALQAADQSFGTKSQIINNKRRTMFVKQSTAQDWRFVMFDSADGVTPKTGLTLAVTIQKQGDTSLGSISPTVTEIGNGHYNAALTTTHMNTVGCVSLRATGTGAVPADCPNSIDVVAFDKTDAFRGTAGSALPGVAAEGAGGLFTRGTGAGQIKQSANGQIDANLATWNLNGTTASTTVPKAMTAAGLAQASDGSGNAIAPASATTAIQADTDDIQTRIPAALTGAGNMKADALRVNGSSTAGANLALQFDGTGLTGGTFPAPQSQVTTLSGDAATGLASLQSDTDDIQSKIGTPAGASVSADIASVKTSVGAVTGAVGSVTGSVGSVTGNVGGDVVGNVQKKILGGGATAITGTGVRAVDDAGNSIASASALTTAQTAITSIQNNTRCVRVVPETIAIPDTGTRTYRIELLLYDENGNMEAPDSAPTIALVNEGGTDRSARLDSTTMSLISAGRYRAIYTSTAGDTEEQLVWTFTVTEGSVARVWGNQSEVGVAASGGGGGASAGYGEQRIEQDASAPIHFTLLDTGGERVTGQTSLLSATISINGGTPAATTGTFTEIDDTDQPGEYYYTPDTGEDSAVGTLVLYLTPDDGEFVPQSVLARVIGPSTVDNAAIASATVDALANYNHDSEDPDVNLGGLWKRQEAWGGGEREISTTGSNQRVKYKDRGGNVVSDGEYDPATGARDMSDVDGDLP